MKFFKVSETRLFWKRAWKAGLVFLALGCGGGGPGTIGAALGKRTDDRLFVREIPPGQGADRAGLRVDDEILLIDGKSVASMNPEEVRRAVRGDVGTTMVLTVLRGTEKLEIPVIRTPLLKEKK
jgi:carboxyl-terminal processing protease